MNFLNILNYFKKLKPLCRAISCAFLAFVAETVQELRICLQHAIDAMRSTETPVTAIASGSELFLRFITLATLDTPVRILTLILCFAPLRINSSFEI